MFRVGELEFDTRAKLLKARVQSLRHNAVGAEAGIWLQAANLQFAQQLITVQTGERDFGQSGSMFSIGELNAKPSLIGNGRCWKRDGEAQPAAAAGLGAYGFHLNGLAVGIQNLRGQAGHEPAPGHMPRGLQLHPENLGTR